MEKNWDSIFETEEIKVLEEKKVEQDAILYEEVQDIISYIRQDINSVNSKLLSEIAFAPNEFLKLLQLIINDYDTHGYYNKEEFVLLLSNINEHLSTMIIDPNLTEEQRKIW